MSPRPALPWRNSDDPLDACVEWSAGWPVASGSAFILKKATICFVAFFRASCRRTISGLHHSPGAMKKMTFSNTPIDTGDDSISLRERSMTNGSMQGRSVLTLQEFNRIEVEKIVDFAISLKSEKRARRFPRRLAHRNIALIFLQPSCRTRASFAVAAADEGATLQILPKEDIRFGIKESTKDIARVLGRLFDGIALRANHSLVSEFAEYSGIPVWNALSETHHPTQVLADLMTIKENFGSIENVEVAFVGDGQSNMVTSLALAARALNFHLRVVSPEQRRPSKSLLDHVNGPGHDGVVSVTANIDRGVRGAQVVYGDIWVSMGQENDTEDLIRTLAPYRITHDVLSRTDRRDSIFLHCLPALHDDRTEFACKYPGVCDVDDDVFEGPGSRVFDQSENRMHTIKSLMISTISG
ncbi:ornithine carbamoyltransferase [Achromobacter aloeverae]